MNDDRVVPWNRDRECVSSGTQVTATATGYKSALHSIIRWYIAYLRDIAHDLTKLIRYIFVRLS